MDESDRDQWRWRGMITQLPPIDQDAIDLAITEARGQESNSVPGVGAP